MPKLPKPDRVFSDVRSPLNVWRWLNILSFPVKRWARRASCFTCLAGAVSACGYRAVYSEGSAEPLCVLAAPPKVPDFDAVHAALDGARSELGRAGALAPEGRYPCLIVELLRIDESAIGVSATPSLDGDRPLGRGVSTAVSGRGWVERQRGGPISRDTGDMRRAVETEVVLELGADAARHRRAVQAAASELGRDLTKRVLGLPAVTGAGR